jgi:hypothetical protein
MHGPESDHRGLPRAARPEGVTVTAYLLAHRNPNGDRFYPTRNAPVLAIVVHITAGLQGRPAGADSSAERTAAYAASTDRKVSWHSGSDRDSHLTLLPDDHTAFHVQGYNSCTVGHEISKRDTTWADEDPRWVTDTLQQAANSLAVRAQRLGIPLRRATRAELDQALAHWKRTGQARPVGFISHQDVDPTRRQDPGRDFPWGRFLSLMNPNPSQEDDMTPAEKLLLSQVAQDVAEVKALLAALVRPRDRDKVDHDPHAVDLGDILTKIETETP